MPAVFGFQGLDAALERGGDRLVIVVLQGHGGGFRVLLNYNAASGTIKCRILVPDKSVILCTIIGGKLHLLYIFRGEPCSSAERGFPAQASTATAHRRRQPKVIQ
jgi:hypothetical protein